MIRRRTAAALAGLLLVPALSACGATKQDELCMQYDHVVAAAKSVRDLDPKTDDATEFRSRVDKLRKELDDLQALAEGRLDKAVSDLRDALTGLKEAAVTASQGSFETARPLLKDSLDDVSAAWSRLKDTVKPECGNG